MTAAGLRVVAAGPLVSFQDVGRPGNMRFGVPASGPMDRLAHAAANLAVGNAPVTTAIEVSLGGLTLECRTGAVTVAVAGGEFVVKHSSAPATGWSVGTLHAGDRLTVGTADRGRWAYVAFAGELDVPRWLGRTATHSMSGFGGGELRSGDEVRVNDARTHLDRHGPIPRPPTDRAGHARVVMGPQDQHFTPESIDAFRSQRYAFTDAADRMGVRLDGPRLTPTSSLSIPSEPVIRGSVQVAGDGVPTLLLADHQTTGGYPKIATVISCDLDALAQLRPPDTISFVAVSPMEAIELTRTLAASSADYLQTITRPSLAQRLMTENLISEADHVGHD